MKNWLKKTVLFFLGTLILQVGLGSVQAALWVDSPCRKDDNPGARTLKAGDKLGPWDEEGTDAYYRAEWIFNWFIDRGFSGWGAAGAVGNMVLESGGTLHPAICEAFTDQIKSLGGVEAVFPGAKEVEGGWYHFDAEEIRGVSGVAGGWGPMQLTPAQMMTEEEYQRNDYEYVNPWSDLGDSWKSMSASQFEEVVRDPRYNEDGLLLHMSYLWLSYDGAWLGTTGLQKGILENPKIFKKVADAQSAEEGSYGFFTYVENGIYESNGGGIAAYMVGEVDGKSRTEYTEKAYELFDGSKYPKADRERLEAKWSANLSPREPLGYQNLPECPKKEHNPGNIVEIAEALVGNWHYRQGETHHVLSDGLLPFLADGRNSPYYTSSNDAHQSDREHFHPGDGTDCSGFVSMVLYWAGVNEIAYRMGDPKTKGGTYNNLHVVDTFTDQVGGNRGGGDGDIYNEYEIIPISQAKAGDTIHNPGYLVGDRAHSAILVEDWKGPQTLICQMGGNLPVVNKQPATTGGFTNESIIVRVTPSDGDRCPDGIEPKELDMEMIARMGNSYVGPDFNKGGPTGSYDGAKPDLSKKNPGGKKPRQNQPVQKGSTAGATGNSKQAGFVSTNGYRPGVLKNFRIDAQNPSHINGKYLDNFLKNHYPDSPLIGHGDAIMRYSKQYGVNVGAYMGQIAKETVFGRSACGGRYNFGCITWTPGSPYGKKYAGDRYWIDPPSVDEGIKAQFKLLRENYIDKGYTTYDRYLERYSPSFENDHSSFESLAYGVMNALAVPIP